MYNISVIIPTYNSWNTLLDCIQSIKNQTLKAKEIVIVDNASTDQTYERIQKSKRKKKKEKIKLKIFRNRKNLGVTGGRNKGIKEASKDCDYLFFFDHDMVADRRMLEELIRVAEKSSDIGIVTPKIYYWNDKKRIWSAGTGINLWTGQVLFRGGKDKGQYEREEEVQVAPASMLVKRKVIDKIKGFDDKYFATFEDTDFCFRAKSAGFKVYYAPKAIAYHKISFNPKNEADRLLNRAYWVGRNRILFMKDFGKFTFWFFIPVFAVYYLRLAIKYRNLGAFFNYLKGIFSGIFS